MPKTNHIQTILIPYSILNTYSIFNYHSSHTHYSTHNHIFISYSSHIQPINKYSSHIHILNIQPINTYSIFNIQPINPYTHIQYSICNPYTTHTHIFTIQPHIHHSSQYTLYVPQYSSHFFPFSSSPPTSSYASAHPNYPSIHCQQSDVRSGQPIAVLQCRCCMIGGGECRGRSWRLHRHRS